MGKHVKTAGAVVIILSLSLTGFADDRAWEFFGPPDSVFGYQAVIEIYNGTPFIGYTAAGYLYRVIVKKYNGAAWENIGDILNTDPNANSEIEDLKIINGTPYVVYTDKDTEYIFVKHYNGVEWQQSGGCLYNDMNSGLVTPQHAQMALSNNTPYVAYVESNSGRKIYVKYYNGNDWLQVGGALNENEEEMSTLDFNFINGEPFVAWSEDLGTADQVVVKYYNGSGWTQAGGYINSDPNRDAWHPSLASINNTPYVSFSQEEVHVKYFNGADWLQVGWPLLQYGYGGHCYSNIIAYKDSVLAAWREGDQLQSAYFNQGDWEQASIKSDPVEWILGDFSMTTYDNTPYITWNQSMSSMCYVKYYIPHTPTPTCSPTGTITTTPTITPTPLPISSGNVIAFPCPAKGDFVWFYYRLESAAGVKINVFNAAGEMCAEISESKDAGFCTTKWDIRNIAPGIYFFILKTEVDGKTQSLKYNKLAIIR